LKLSVDEKKKEHKIYIRFILTSVTENTSLEGCRFI